MNDVIDLGVYRSPESRVYAGRARGEQVRKATKLDDIDQTQRSVHVIVPADVFSINTSFFLGMFGPSIRALGAELFRRKYVFEGKSISRVYEAAIREALTTDSPLRGPA